MYLFRFSQQCDLAHPVMLEWHRVIGYSVPDFSAQLSGIIYQGPVGMAEKIALFLDCFAQKGGGDMLSQSVCNRPQAYAT
jgi:hypothetical protein